MKYLTLLLDTPRHAAYTLCQLTCGSLQCRHHLPIDSPDGRTEDDERPLVPRVLTPYQLNFRYEERGEIKAALVKVVLCDRCARKLTYKKDKERARERLQAQEESMSKTPTVRQRDEQELSPERRSLRDVEKRPNRQERERETR